MIETIDSVEREDRNWAVAAHLSAIGGGMVFPFGNIIGPLIVYLSNRDKWPFATAHAKASLNFQITMTIASVLFLIIGGIIYGVALATMVATTPDSSKNSPIAGLALTVALAPIVFCLVFAIWALVRTIMGAVAAGNGLPYRYPLTINFLK